MSRWKIAAKFLVEKKTIFTGGKKMQLKKIRSGPVHSLGKLKYYCQAYHRRRGHTWGRRGVCDFFGFRCWGPLFLLPGRTKHLPGSAAVVLPKTRYPNIARDYSATDFTRTTPTPSYLSVVTRARARRKPSVSIYNYFTTLSLAHSLIIRTHGIVLTSPHGPRDFVVPSCNHDKPLR